MCISQQSNEFILAILGIVGTLTGVFIGAYFSYRSIDKEFRNSIKRMRAERRMNAYEELFGHVIIAKQTRQHENNGSQYEISVVLASPALFSEWYPKYHIAWSQKQYHLDESSLNACNAISVFVQEFINEHPDWHSNPHPGQTPREYSLDPHTRFLSLLNEAYRSLKIYLDESIEGT